MNEKKISSYISRYHFSQIFRTSFRIICKKDFRHEFSFLTDSLKPPLLVWGEYNQFFLVLHRAQSRLLVSIQRYFSVVIKLQHLHRFLHR